MQAPQHIFIHSQQIDIRSITITQCCGCPEKTGQVKLQFNRRFNNKKEITFG